MVLRILMSICGFHYEVKIETSNFNLVAAASKKADIF